MPAWQPCCIVKERVGTLPWTEELLATRMSGDCHHTDSPAVSCNQTSALFICYLGRITGCLIFHDCSGLDPTVLSALQQCSSPAY